jgi:hypothetical protein
MANPLIISGPRKRKENSRFVENANPGPLPRNKKAKVAKPTPNSTVEHVPMAKRQEKHPQPDLEEDANATLTTQQVSPQNTDCTSKGVDGRNDEDSLESSDEDPSKEPIDVDASGEEDVEECADDKLGESN